MKHPILSSPLCKQACYIDGQWRQGEQWIAIDNPANGQVIGRVPRFGALETEQAVAAAARALAPWRSLTAAERGRLLRRWSELMLHHQHELGALMTLEQGKPLAEACGEIAYAASFLEWFGEEGKRAYGETIPAATSAQRLVTIKQGVGVCAAITPWNFPSSMITRKAGAALAAGCTMVVKPAAATPLSALALAVLAEQAGIPPGVFNVITGTASIIADTLTASPMVRKISFTGSTEVGSKLMAAAAQHVQKISLELGGNAPFIVFEDADIERAVAGAMAAKFRNTGQTCVCVNRFLVQRAVEPEFRRRLAAAMAELKLGDGLAEGVTQSALIDRAAVAKVVAHIDDALANGGELLAGGAHTAQGNFIAPTLIANGTPAMLACQEETFGPLALLVAFDSEAEAIALANDTRYGLAAYFYSGNIDRCWRVAEQLEAGMVGINEGIISNAAAPFGGVKASGLGREGSHYGLDEYLEVKYLCFGTG